MSFSPLANRHVCARCGGSLLAEYVQLGEVRFGELLVCIHCGEEENNAAIRRATGMPGHLFQGPKLERPTAGHRKLR